MSVLAVGASSAHPHQVSSNSKRTWEQVCGAHSSPAAASTHAQVQAQAFAQTSRGPAERRADLLYADGEETPASSFAIESLLRSSKRARSTVNAVHQNLPLSESQNFYRRQVAIEVESVRILKERFPHMEEAELTKTLSVCGNNVEEAIRRIEQLCLARSNMFQDTTVNGKVGTCEQLEEGSNDENLQACEAKLPREQQHNMGRQEDTNRVGAEQRPDHQDGCINDGAEGSVTDKATLSFSGEDWVEILVQEMTQAKDISDAKIRADKVLRAFEAAVSHQVCGGVSPATMRQQASDLLRDSAILKRALKIQMNKEQERELEIQALRQQIESYKEQLARAELSNYSLAVHLREATSNSNANEMQQRRPDIF